MPDVAEVEYWDGISEAVTSEKGVKADNLWKRRYQIQKLLQYPWMGEKVLEIGLGNAVIAGTLNTMLQRSWDYVGTDLSGNFMACAATNFKLNTVQADVRELPGFGYTRILALDSLEHVRPDHREEGYRKIADVAAQGCKLFIHYSHSVSHHDKKFDHPFGLEDLVRLEKVGFSLRVFDRYVCEHPHGNMDYVFAVMQK